jgi:hypothetical protein
MGGVDIDLHSFLTLALKWVEVVSQYHTVATLHPRNNPGPIALEVGWTPEPVWTFWRREKFGSLLGFET